MKYLAPLLAVVSALWLTSCAAFDRMDHPRLREKVKYEGTISGGMVEGKRSIQATVTLKRQSTRSPGGVWQDPVKLEIESVGGERLEEPWPGSLPSKVSFEPNKQYRVELLTRIYRNPDYIFNDLLRISDGDNVIADTSSCSLHKQPMQRQVENQKSIGAYPDSFTLTRKKRFPTDGNVYLGCGSGIRHPLWKCPECEKEYHRWTKRHGIDESW